MRVESVTTKAQRDMVKPGTNHFDGDASSGGDVSVSVVAQRDTKKLPQIRRMRM